MKKLLIVILLLATCIAFLPISTRAITLGEYEAKVAKYKADAAKIKGQINMTQAQINAANKEIANIKAEMIRLAKEIETKRAEIVKMNEEIKEKSLQTKQLFEYLQLSGGENTYLAYAFGAETITDLIYRMSIVEQMTDYNNGVIKELEEMIEANKKREIEIKDRQKQITQKEKELETKVTSLGEKRSSLQDGGVTVAGQIKIYEDIVKSYKALGCKSKDVIGVDCAKTGSAGVFRRPTSWGYVTSEFGWRNGSFHRGLDISNGDPYNTKIYPVANGTISAKYYDIYGALVLAIEHYDTVTGKYWTSLYAHMSSYAPNTYIGKYVTSDNYLGIMGNTGYSFGAHLHLEIAPCRLYRDNSCMDLNRYMSFVQSQANKGFKGPRQMISFPSGTYKSWNSR